MIMNSYPFDSIVTTDEHGDPIYDRAVSSDFLQKLQRKDRSYGVIALNNLGDMMVNAGSTGLTVTVNNGYCFIRGCYGWYDEPQTLELAPAVNNDRIDAIVLRLNTAMSVRGIELVVKQGEEAAKPVAPSMNRAGTIWELGLANVRVKAGASGIEQQYIEDTRANPLRCGISTPMQEIDTSMLYTQIQDQINRNLELIQHALDDTMAGHLQNEIDEINAKFPPINESLSQLDTKITQTNNRFTGVESRTLLWQNARPTNAFLPQTITIDLTNFDKVSVMFVTTGLDDRSRLIREYLAYFNAPVKCQEWKCVDVLHKNETVPPEIRGRGFELSRTGLKFYGGWWKYTVDASAATTEQSNMIPIAIYGIKEA